MMHPVIQGIGNWSVFFLELGLILLQKVAVVFWNTMILFLMLVEIELELILPYHFLACIAVAGQLFSSILLGFFDGFEFFVVQFTSLPLVILFSLEKFV